MSDSYEDLLNMQWDEIPAVKTLPSGSWLLRGSNGSVIRGKDGNSDQVLLVYNPKEPMSDVDEDQLAELGADYEFENNRIFVKFFVENAADMDKVRKHLLKHGIDLAGRTIKQTLKEDFKGTEVIAYLGQRTYTDNNGEQQTDNTANQFTAVEA